MTQKAELPKATVVDSTATVAKVMGGTMAKGVLIRRPRVVGMAESAGLDTMAVSQLQHLHDKYGDGPVILKAPGPPRAVILSPKDARFVLDHSPEPFAMDQTEKREALGHFEPNHSLISRGPEREQRRALSVAVLDPGKRVHPMAQAFREKIDSGFTHLIQEARSKGELGWEEFIHAWYAMVRSLVLGEGAREDEELTDILAQLRARSNWSYLWPKNEGLQKDFFSRLQIYLDRAEAGSLAGAVAKTSTGPEAAAPDQVAHWLFAFDPGAMATFRALALLASHPHQLPKASAESDGPDAEKLDKPFLRACVLESLRLWPTTPAILRETTEEVEFANGVMPKGSSVLIFAPYFHRDDRKLSFAHAFVPEIWGEEDSTQDWLFVPFSGGPAKCAGHDIVPLVCSHVLSVLLRGQKVELVHPERLPAGELPGTLDNYSLRFKVTMA